MIRFLKRNFIILLILLILVVYLQYLLLQPVLKMGFSYEDWFMLDFFRILGPDPLSRIFYVVESLGPYYIQEYWIGMLVNIFGSDNLIPLRVFSIGLKVFETLIVYSAALLFFDRRLLAFLAALFYATHYSATSSLEDVISGPDYLVGLFLLVFLAIYYHIVKNKLLNLKWLSLLFLSLIATMFFQPVRAYTVLTLPFLIEALLIISHYSKSSLKNSLVRLIVLSPVYLLIIMIFVLVQEKFTVNTTPQFLSSVLRGDWYFTLHPLAGLSTLFIPPEYLSKVFGSETLNPNNLFINYLSFLLRKPLIFFGILTYIFSFLIKPSWLGRFKFILITLVLNFVFQIAVFLIYNLRYDSIANYQNPSELAGMYPIFFGIFLLLLNFWAIYGWWRRGKKNNLLWAFWSGLTFTFIFLVLTRLMADEVFAYKTIHRYLVTASLGASLCLGSLLSLLYDKITSNSSHAYLSRSFGNILMFLILIAFYSMSNQQISNYFNSQLDHGRSSQAQEMMHQRFLDKFQKYSYDPSKSSLFYFEDASGSSTDGLFLQESFQSHFMYWMHLKSPKLVKGCIQDTGGTIDSLKEFVKVKNGVKGIYLGAYCINPETGTYDSLVPTFFLPQNLYSFRVKNREFIDSRDEVLKELGFN